MKKITFTLLALVCALCCALGLAACGGGTDSDGDGHHYATVWTYSPTYHWHQCSDEDCEEPEKDKAAHSDENDDGKCDICNIVIPSQGIEFGTYSDIYNPEYCGSVCIASLGSCTDTALILPSTNENGEPIIAIEIDAFSNSDITSVVIPETVEVIGRDAFYGCESLENITFTGNNLKIIEGGFRGCTSLKSLVIPEGVTHIGETAFMECELESLSLPSTLKSIGGEAFSYFKNKETYNEYENGYYLGNEQNPYMVLVGIITNTATTFTIHEDTKLIGSGAFSSYVINVTMSANVIFIADRAFAGSGYIEIQYGGTVAQWDAIEKSGFRNNQRGEMIVHCTDDLKNYPTN